MSNLKPLLKDIADAIRDKRGTSEPIKASDFASEILSIETGITPSGELEITENGTYDVTNYASANVNVTGGEYNIEAIELDDGTQELYVTMAGSGSVSNPYKTIMENGNDGRYLFANFQGTDINQYWDKVKNNVTYLGGLFAFCKNVTQINDANITPSASAVIISSIFEGCQKLTQLPTLLAPELAKNISDLRRAFRQCKALTQINLSNFLNGCGVSLALGDTSSQIFDTCSNVVTITLLNDTALKTQNSTYQMFYNCAKLTNIIGAIDLVDTIYTYRMFDRCTNLINFTLKNIKTSLDISKTIASNETLINTAKELHNLTYNTETLTVSANAYDFYSNNYVKLIDITDDMILNDAYISEKKPCEICLSTDEGAMTLADYIISKNWNISIY